MNIAIDGETPYDNGDIYKYLQRHMNVMKSMVISQYYGKSNSITIPGEDEYTWVTSKGGNLSFYTTDGMRFEFPMGGGMVPLRENKRIFLRGVYQGLTYDKDHDDLSRIRQYNMIDGNNHCGSYGLKNNPDNTLNPPCIIVVDVNGDRKPFPKNASCFKMTGCEKENIRLYSDPKGKKLTDTFSLMITDRAVLPYGVAAQKAMYESQEKREAPKNTPVEEEEEDEE